jgi:hypothetical protein
MDERREAPFNPGPIGRAGAAGGLLASDMVAIALAVIWVVAVVAHRFSLTEGAAAPGLFATSVVVALPLALIGATAVTVRALQLLRREAQELRATVEALRAAQRTARAAGAILRPPGPSRGGEGSGASFATRREAHASPPPAAPEPAPGTSADQPALALGGLAEAPPVPVAPGDVVRALQFPEDAEDHEGFRALRRALEDRETAKLIRTAQDVLTLLSQEGIYMDDLQPDTARPEVWRRFAGGERGRGIAALGGIRDRASLALTASRMREDAVFRDAGHHFLRSFDRGLAAFEKEASDADLMALADTRTARAFMLFGRVAGIFD